MSSGLEPNASKTARAGAAALALALLATVAGSGIGPWLAQWTGSSARLIIPGLVSALTALAAWLTCLSLLPAALAGERPGAGARIGLAAVGGGLAFGVTLWAQGSFTGAAALGLGGATGFFDQLGRITGRSPDLCLYFHLVGHDRPNLGSGALHSGSGQVDRHRRAAGRRGRVLPGSTAKELINPLQPGLSGPVNRRSGAGSSPE